MKTRMFLHKGIYTFMFAFAAQAAYSAPITFPITTGFGKVTVGATKTISYTVKNSSTAKVRLDSYWFSGTGFSVTGGTCQYNQSSGYVLAAAATCTVNIKFAPTTTGIKSAKFTLGYYPGTSWTWNESYLALSGEGVTIAPTPTPTPTTTPTPTPTTTPTPTPTTTPTTAWLKVSGNKIVNDQGQQVILKGVNIADPEALDTKANERPNVSARSVAALATDQYFAEVIRLPILPGNSSYPNEGFLNTKNGFDTYYNNHLKSLVDELTSKGKYVIIDLHYISDYGSLWPQVQKFWTFMAPKFANNPHVLYEVFNEPILPDNWSTWKNTIAQPAVNLIRSYAPNNLILVGGPYWSSHMSGAATDPISGTNIVYVGHVYSNQNKAMWDSRYLPVLQKYPMFFTEWGFETGGTEGGDLTWGKSFESWMRSYNASWTTWNFDILWGPRMLNSDWSLRASPGGEGVFVRDLLVEEHNK